MSVVSQLEITDARRRAEQVFEMLVAILETSANFTKFTSSLPMTRICLLLLGDRPTPLVATLVLRMIQISLKVSVTFSRKFELVSGWNTLKTVLPYAWSPRVQTAAFDVLLGGAYSTQSSQLVLVCPHMLPVILSCLKFELDILSGRGQIGHHIRSKLLSHVDHSPTNARL